MYKLLSAASNGDIEIMRMLLSQGKSVNTADYDGRSALMLAARENQEVCERKCKSFGVMSARALG